MSNEWQRVENYYYKNSLNRIVKISGNQQGFTCIKDEYGRLVVENYGTLSDAMHAGDQFLSEDIGTVINFWDIYFPEDCGHPLETTPGDST